MTSETPNILPIATIELFLIKLTIVSLSGLSETLAPKAACSSEQNLKPELIGTSHTPHLMHLLIRSHFYLFFS